MARHIVANVGAEVPLLFQPDELGWLDHFVEGLPTTPSIGPQVRHHARVAMARLGFVPEWDAFAFYAGMTVHELTEQQLVVGDTLAALQLGVEAKRSNELLVVEARNTFVPWLDPQHVTARHVDSVIKAIAKRADGIRQARGLRPFTARTSRLAD